MTRPKKPWYSDRVNQQKQVVRKREKTWRKYRQHHHWTALQVEQEKYKIMLNTTKQETLGNEIAECGNNTKNYTHWLST